MNATATDVLRSALGNPEVVDGYLILGNGLRVQAEPTRHQEHPQGHMVMMAFRAVHDGLFPEGIDDVTAGVGATYDEALERATKIWMDGTLPVLQELFNDGEPDPDVSHLDLAVADVQEKRTFIWEMLLGPLQVAGLSPEELSSPEEGRHVILQALMDAVTGVLGERRLLWIKCSITKPPSGEISGDCWLNNQPWTEGLVALQGLADSWPPRPKLQIRRQFLLCRPTDRPAPEAEEALREQIAALEKEGPKKKWWPFWK